MGRGLCQLAVAIVVALLSIPSTMESAAVSGDDDTQNRFTRVRAADPELRRLVGEGVSRSATFLAIADEIQRSSGIVMLRFGRCPTGSFRSCVSGVEGDARQRHIRIFVDTRTTEDRLIATIAHELHHALEILRDPEAVDAKRVLALYRRISKGDCRKGLSDACETVEALRIEAVVQEELSRSGMRPAASPK